MPEGDSLYRYAARLRPALVDKEIVSARAHGPGAVPRVSAIVGATCTAVRSQGKNMLISFDNGLALRGHLRMYGSWHIYRLGESWLRPESDVRLVLEVHDAVVVNFGAPVIELIEERALAFHRPIASLGPDLLDEMFDAEAAFANFRQRAIAGRTIGEAIMDQTLMAGVGNIWKHETLFRCGLNPWLTLRELRDEDLRTVISTAHQLLRASVGKPNSLMSRGRPTMFAYLRGGQPCRRCGTRLRSAPQGGDIRQTAWCPRCQAQRPEQVAHPVPRHQTLPVRGRHDL